MELAQMFSDRLILAVLNLQVLQPETAVYSDI
jgi:hypothetical protein